MSRGDVHDAAETQEGNAQRPAAAGKPRDGARSAGEIDRCGQSGFFAGPDRAVDTVARNPLHTTMPASTHVEKAASKIVRTRIVITISGASVKEGCSLQAISVGRRLYFGVLLYGDPGDLANAKANGGDRAAGSPWPPRC